MGSMGDWGLERNGVRKIFFISPKGLQRNVGRLLVNVVPIGIQLQPKYNIEDKRQTESGGNEWVADLGGGGEQPCETPGDLAEDGKG